jgi:hypothetical protein
VRNKPNFQSAGRLGTPDCAKRTQFAQRPGMGAGGRGWEAPPGSNCAKRTQFPVSRGLGTPDCAKRTQFGPASAGPRSVKDAKRTQFRSAGWLRTPDCAKRSQFGPGAREWARVAGAGRPRPGAINCAKRTQFGPASAGPRSMKDAKRTQFRSGGVGDARLCKTNPICPRTGRQGLGRTQLSKTPGRGRCLTAQGQTTIVQGYQTCCGTGRPQDWSRNETT